MKASNFRRRTLVVLAMIAWVAPLFIGGSAWAADSAKEFTTDFRIEDCTFSATGRNAYFSLNPGDVLLLSNGEAELTISVLNRTRVIEFITAKGVPLKVTTRVVEELETENNQVVERSRNFFARCRETNDIFYFGEEVEPAAIGGAWLAGVDGALPGIIMPGTFLLGSRYFQEQAPDVALDRAEHVAMGLTVTVPAGTFEDCVEVVETTKLEGGKSTKRYCPGIGLIFDDGLELVSHDVSGH